MQLYTIGIKWTAAAARANIVMRDAARPGRYRAPDLFDTPDSAAIRCVRAQAHDALTRSD